MKHIKIESYLTGEGFEKLEKIGLHRKMKTSLLLDAQIQFASELTIIQKESEEKTPMYCMSFFVMDEIEHEWIAKRLRDINELVKDKIAKQHIESLIGAFSEIKNKRWV